MDIKINKCKLCHSDLDKPVGRNNFIRCRFCGCVNEIESKKDDAYQSSLENIYRLIRDAEFEKADELLQELLKKYPEEGELYFVKVLVDSRIIYVFEGEKRIPTYTSVNFDIDNQKNVKKALEFAFNDEQKKFFEEQFKVIENDRNEIKKIIDSKQPKYEYDIFISFKKSSLEDPNEDTPEADIADKIYKHLLRNHHDLKVFYAPECLTPGESWERQIFNALYRSKCMILVGSNISNLNAPWVKNEWNRYLEMMNSGKKAKGSLIPIVLNGDFYGVLPAKLSAIQGLAADVALLSKLSSMLEELFTAHNEEKKIETKKFAEFKGIKVKAEKHEDVDIDLDALTMLAETDKNLAMKELDKFDPNIQRVKEIKFIIEENKFDDVKTYVGKADKLRFYEKLGNIVTANNIDVIADTIIKFSNGKAGSFKDRCASTLFLLPYIENLSKDNRTALVKSVAKQFKDSMSDSSNGDAAELVKQELDIYLSLNEVSDDEKQEILYLYCGYLLKIFKESGDKKYIDDFKDKLGYIQHSETKKSGVAKPFNFKDASYLSKNWMELVDENYADLRTTLFSSLVSTYMQLEQFDSAQATIDNLLEEITEPRLQVVASYWKMICAFTRCMITKNGNFDELEKGYHSTSVYVAKNLKDKKVLDELKSIYENMKSLIDEYLNKALVFEVKGKTYTPYDKTKLVDGVSKYNPTISKILSSFFDECDGKRQETFKIIKGYETAKKGSDDVLEVYKKNYDYANSETETIKILDSISNSEVFTEKLGDFVQFLSEKGFDKEKLDKYQKIYEGFVKSKKDDVRKEDNKGHFLTFINIITLLAFAAGTFLELYFFGDEEYLFIGSILQASAVLLFVIFDMIGTFTYPPIYEWIDGAYRDSYGDARFIMISRSIFSVFASFMWFMVFYMAMNFDVGHNTRLLIMVIVMAVAFLGFAITRAFTMECDSNYLKYSDCAGTVLSLGALIVAVVPFLIRSFTHNPEFVFYVEGVYNNANGNSLLYYALFLLGLAIPIAMYIVLMFFFHLDGVYEVDTLGLVFFYIGIVVAWLAYAACAVACVFSYFLPNPGMAGVVVISIVSFGLPLIDVIVGSIAAEEA